MRHVGHGVYPRNFRPGRWVFGPRPGDDVGQVGRVEYGTVTVGDHKRGGTDMMTLVLAVFLGALGAFLGWGAGGFAIDFRPAFALFGGLLAAAVGPSSAARTTW